MVDNIEKQGSKRSSIWRELFFPPKLGATEESEVSSVPFFKLFRYATSFEIFIALLGVFCSVLMSTSPTTLTIVYGEFLSLLVDYKTGSSATKVFLLKLFGGGRILTNPSQQEIEDAIIENSKAFAISFVVICGTMFLFGAISVYLLNYTALKQIGRIRAKFFRAVLKQDMSWYDTHTNLNFASRVTEDLNKLKDGIGEKIAIFTFLTAGFVIAVIVSFVYGWQLTLVALSCTPVIILSTALVSKIQGSLTVKELDAYGLAGTVAEEIFSAIRTVTAFSGEQKECERYAQKLIPAIKQGQRKGFISGIGNGIMWFVIYCSEALALWYGIELILQDRDSEDPIYTMGVLNVVFFSVLFRAHGLGMSSPFLEAFATAKGSAATVFSIIDLESKIDPFSQSGLKPKSVTGNIEFKDIHFHYPSRPDVKVLQGVSFSVKAGETVALVGSSGCGKSTIIQLLQRLYDPTHGKIYLDGNEISSLNVKWLRSHIGVVGQEPVLFSTTVHTNISYGKLGATEEEIEFAAKQANCHEFIRKLPKGYYTHISSAQLSGGQKQRIAIARALINEPRILLLDEATSALDLQSEAKVQETLDQARLGRTTIVVAHRLSTIKNADRIVVINNGVVIESGTHDELMSLKGHYYDLVATEAAVEMKNTNQENVRPKLEKLSSVTESHHGDKRISKYDEEFEETYKTSFSRIVKMNKPEILYLIVGAITSILIGAAFPAFAMLFGEIYGILALENQEEIRKYSRMYSLCFVALGITSGIASFLQSYTFSVAGVRLTTRLRNLAFSSMIKQEIAWYDSPKNSVGSLCSRLADDASSVQGATGACIGTFVQAFTTFALGLFIGFFYTWKMSLVCAAIMPLTLASVYYEVKVTKGFAIAEKKYIEDATKIAVEAISNIRTVASLCQEETFYKNYLEELENVNQALKAKTRLRGVVYSFGQSFPYFGVGISFSYGGYLIAREGLDYSDIIKVSEALIIGTWIIGQALAFSPNFSAAKLSAARIFKIMDRVPKIRSDPLSVNNDKLVCQGNISYKNVNFHYPTRPEIQVLKDFSLEVNAGKRIALVGFSGCGKSTVIQLLQRFYDPDSGALMIDNYNIKNELSLPCLRKQLGIVSQEPVLFDRTIAENIAYGDNSRNIPMSEIVEAAKQANIHNFISSLPLGYETSLGTKGTQLSGGQKQRIAIARALVRHPRILLLDEATSALDRQSEKVVQEALDKAQEGRTCIVIAHRLITIKDADLICVMQNGRIVEIGTHTGLLAQGGLYYELYNLTSKDSN